MADWVRATIWTIAIFTITAIVSGVSWYAAGDPEFVIRILLPILVSFLILCVWMFCYNMIKAR